MRSFATLLLALVLSACDIPSREFSKELHESGKVLQTIYTPATHGSASGTSVDFDLNVKFHNMTINTQEQFGVMFQCEHGQFVVTGTSERYKKLWESLPKDSNVTIYYREEYLTYKDGRRELTGFDFLRAERSQ